MDAKLTKEDWLNEMLAATLVVVKTSLSADNCSVKVNDNGFSLNDISGAYMPLIGEKDAVLIGLLSNQKGIQALARSFSGLKPEEEELSREDRIDAIRELLNIISGLLKGQMLERNPVHRSGLPIFIDGYFELTKSQESACTLVEIDTIKIYLVIIRSKSIDFQKTFPRSCDMKSKMTVQDWLEEALDAMAILAKTNLGEDNYMIKDKKHTFPKDDVWGAYIPLVGQDDAVLIGILSNQHGIQELARFLLGLDPEDEELSKEDTVEAIGEILNMLCGIVKRQMVKRKATLWIGMPNFTRGNIELTNNQESACASVEIRNVKTYLVIVRRQWKKMDAT